MSAERLVEQRAMVLWMAKAFFAVAILAAVAAIWGGASVGGVAAGMMVMACAAMSIYHTLAYTHRLQVAFEMLKIHTRRPPDLIVGSPPINMVAGDTFEVCTGSHTARFEALSNCSLRRVA